MAFVDFRLPNNAEHAATSIFTGCVNAKEHTDQYWVNAMTRHYLEWIVFELKKTFLRVKFFGQDDKANVVSGDKVRF